MPYGRHFSVASDPTVRFEENWDFKHQKLKVRATRNQAGIIQTRELSTMLATKKSLARNSRGSCPNIRVYHPKIEIATIKTLNFHHLVLGCSGSKP